MVYDYKHDTTTNTESTFDRCILPLLQEFAEMTSSLLNVKYLEERHIIVASFSNALGFDITESCTTIKGLLIMADHIGINIEDRESNLVLIFNCSQFD